MADVLTDQIEKMKSSYSLELPELEGTEKCVVEILVCKVRHVPLVLKLLARVFEPLNIRLSAGLKEGDLLRALDDVSTILDIMANQYDLIVELIESMTNLPKEKVVDIPLDWTFLIIKKIIEVNYGFFMVRVYPLLAKVDALNSFVENIQRQKSLDLNSPKV